MKKLIVTLSLVLFANVFYGQTVFDKFDNQDDISAFVVNKKMFDLMSKVEVKDKESKQYMELISKLDNLKVLNLYQSEFITELEVAKLRAKLTNCAIYD